jgi:hypothetical protein
MGLWSDIKLLFKVSELLSAFTRLATAGVSYSEYNKALEVFTKALDDSEEAEPVNSYYRMGIVPRVTVQTTQGDTIDFTDAELEVEIVQETLDHYTVAGGERAKTQVVVNEKTKIKVKAASADKAEELFRLIRND